MVKFTEGKKKEVKGSIKKVGEELFLKYGIKKVTIDDIVTEVNIGKGTFYIFFDNKYDLFLDISGDRQRQIFSMVEEVIKQERFEKNRDMSLEEIIFYLIELYSKDEFLRMLNGDAKEILQKKASDILIERHLKMDSFFMAKLEAFGLDLEVPQEVFLEIMDLIFMYGIEVLSCKKDDRALRQLIAMSTKCNLSSTKMRL